MKWPTIALIVALVLAIGAASYEGYMIYQYKKVLHATTTSLASSTARISSLNSDLSTSQTILQDAADRNDELEHNLEAEKNRNDQFESQIHKLGSTVTTLDKLANTDPELLKKYSKVYFLNENYMPKKLVPIDKQYLYDKTKPEFMLSDIEPFFTDMMEAASNAEIKISVVSAFRSFDEQKDLKSQYAVVYGSGANSFSADQGYSEHQLGTAFDFTSGELQGGLDGFDKSNAFMWLTKNAYKYGFVLSYPRNNAYYVFEPWHWRFVGRDLAGYLHKHDQFFYDLDQRTIDSYLISILD